MMNKSLTQSPPLSSKSTTEESAETDLAARHLADSRESVLLAGAEEPTDWATHRGVFASHYDEARTVSQSGPDEIMPLFSFNLQPIGRSGCSIPNLNGIQRINE